MNANIRRTHSERALDLTPGNAIATGLWLERILGPWNYKDQGGKYVGRYEAGGNFNYGATGRALGISGAILARAGGAFALARGGSSDGGHPLGRSPYGDTKEDLGQVQAGVSYYNQGCYR